MAYLSPGEALRVSDAMLMTLYGLELFGEWKRVKQEMGFTSEKEYIKWILPIISQYKSGCDAPVVNCKDIDVKDVKDATTVGGSNDDMCQVVCIKQTAATNSGSAVKAGVKEPQLSNEVDAGSESDVAIVAEVSEKPRKVSGRKRGRKSSMSTPLCKPDITAPHVTSHTEQDRSAGVSTPSKRRYARKSLTANDSMGEEEEAESSPEQHSHNSTSVFPEVDGMYVSDAANAAVDIDKSLCPKALVSPRMKTTAIGSYICMQEECGREFLDQAAYRKHQRVCHNTRAHTCPECGKTFKENSKLRRHQLIHTGVKAFRCPVPECSKSFAYEHNLKTHVRTHTGEKPYVCERCGKAFAQLTNLRSHMVSAKACSKALLRRSPSLVSSGRK